MAGRWGEVPEGDDFGQLGGISSVFWGLFSAR